MHTLNVYDTSRLHKNVNNIRCVWDLFSNWNLSKKNFIASNQYSPRRGIKHGGCRLKRRKARGDSWFWLCFPCKTTCLDFFPISYNQIWRSLRKNTFKLFVPRNWRRVWNTKMIDSIVKIWLGSVESTTPVRSLFKFFCSWFCSPHNVRQCPFRNQNILLWKTCKIIVERA